MTALSPAVMPQVRDRGQVMEPHRYSDVFLVVDTVTGGRAVSRCEPLHRHLFVTHAREPSFSCRGPDGLAERMWAI